MTNIASHDPPPPSRSEDVDAEPDQPRDWLVGAEVRRRAQRSAGLDSRDDLEQRLRDLRASRPERRGERAR